MGKRFGSALELKELATPSGNPPSGSRLLYVKSDGKLYRKDSSGVETDVVGSGGGGAGGAVVQPGAPAGPATGALWYDTDEPEPPVAVVEKQTEIDFGTSSRGSGTFTVVDAAVSAFSRILATQAGDAPTGRSADENEMDPLVISAQPAAGQFTLYVTPLHGPVQGKYKVNYLIG